jgi:hypothetical protein
MALETDENNQKTKPHMSPSEMNSRRKRTALPCIALKLLTDNGDKLWRARVEMMVKACFFPSEYGSSMCPWIPHDMKSDFSMLIVQKQVTQQETDNQEESYSSASAFNLQQRRR